MNRNQYTIPLEYYYKINGWAQVTLGYRQGADQLRLVIADGRERVISEVDGAYLYLIVRTEKDPQEILDDEDDEEDDDDVFVDYRKCNAKCEGGEYVINIEELFSELKLTFHELSDEEFAEVLKYERQYQTEELYPYGKMNKDSFWADDEIFSVCVHYLQDALVIGDRAIRYIQRDTILEEDPCNELVAESASEKTCMDLEKFKEFVEKAEGLVYLTFEWENGYVSRTTMGGNAKWHYKACFDDNGEKKIVSAEVDDGKQYTASFMYHFMQCKSFQEFDRINKKKKVLGV